MKPFLLILDHGTTGIKCCLMTQAGELVATAYRKITQHYPLAGWVEHSPEELWQLTQAAMVEVLVEGQATWAQIEAIGLTNQRETTVLWDKATGEPVYPAIVWQCRRTAEWCDALKEDAALTQRIREKTGLVLDAYFSASKIRWILDHRSQSQTLLGQNNLLFGTVDTWILWHLSGGQCHATDFTNASRTMLYNIREKEWDPELLAIFGIPPEILPEVKPSSGFFAETAPDLTGGRAIPILSVVGDQQSALFGQRCWTPGTCKNTFGTGAFLMMHLGQSFQLSDTGLLTTLACSETGEPAYAFEGAIFIAGAAMEWLKTLGLFERFEEADKMARELRDNNGVYLVPAFVGLGAPYWRGDARGVLCGLTQGAGKAHLVRAGLESMAYQVDEMLTLMKTTAHLTLQGLKIDGGVSRSHFLMQFLADLIQTPVIRMRDTDLTAKGAGYLAGLACGFWPDAAALAQLPEASDRFTPHTGDVRHQAWKAGWKKAVERSLLP